MIAENYANFNDSCMKRAEGKQSEADYLMNCSYFEYYNRLLVYKRYAEWQKSEMDKVKSK